MSDRDLTTERESLWYIADQIQSWIDWDRAHRSAESLSTDANTHIIALPVPFWPSHGQMERWIKTLHAASGLDRHPFRAANGQPKDTTP